jgi:hypothetical protein
LGGWPPRCSNQPTPTLYHNCNEIKNKFPRFFREIWQKNCSCQRTTFVQFSVWRFLASKGLLSLPIAGVFQLRSPYSAFSPPIRCWRPSAVTSQAGQASSRPLPWSWRR